MTKEYEAAAHGMQSGVAMEMNHRSGPTEPKHLRVGINAAMANHCGLVQLLIAKGVFTEEEYLKAITKSMEDERDRYEKHLSHILGFRVKLR